MTNEQFIPQNPIPQKQEPFAEFIPVLWNPQKKNLNHHKHIYSIRRNHGILGTYKLHNLNDAINDDLPTARKVIIEYKINNCRYPIFTIGDLLNQTYPIDVNGQGNILGDIAERIARRIIKYFLQHWSKQGRTGGVFNQRFDPQNRDNFIVAHTNEYILKIHRYPNLVILKRSGKGKFGYENIKELDGFFEYRYMNKRHILVLESKLERINVDCEDLITNLFIPLRHIFPDASFHYILFTDKYSIYSKTNYNRYRQLKDTPVKIHNRLKTEGIGTLFFTFNESRDDFEKIKNFLIVQYRAIKKMAITILGKAVISEKELMIFDGGETPHIKLIKDLKCGMWKEIHMRHKK